MLLEIEFTKEEYEMCGECIFILLYTVQATQDEYM